MNAEYIYETLLGERIDPCPGIANAFAEGSHCAKLYEEIYHANLRLCNRLAIQEDADVELLINNFFEIMHEVSIQMFRYGQRFTCER